MVIFVKPVEFDCMEYCGPNRQEDGVLYCLKILMRAISGHKLLSGVYTVSSRIALCPILLPTLLRANCSASQPIESSLECEKRSLKSSIAWTRTFSSCLACDGQSSLDSFQSRCRLHICQKFRSLDPSY